MHEADIGDYFETYENDGKVMERPKRLTDLSPEIRKNIEKITIDGKGRAVPQLYLKLAASQELRKMLNIERSEHRNDLSRLSDAELIAQEQAGRGATRLIAQLPALVTVEASVQW
jgi:hypothetical protein